MLKYLKLFEQFLTEKKPAGAPEFYHSDAPDAEGRFKDLSIKDLAAWLIKTRKKDVKKISGSLTQQIVFNRKSDPKYAEKMEKTRKEVYKQLGREDLLKEALLEKGYNMDDIHDLIAFHRFNKDFRKLSAKDKEWVENDAKERGFNESANVESDLHKIYLAINPKSGHTWWYTPFAEEKFMNQLSDDNHMKVDINKDYPVMNWKKEVTETLINKGLVKKKNVYNLPENVNMSYKKEFHKLVDGQDHIPKTVNNTKDALKLGFPLIGKPTDSHSGIGIQVFKNQKEWDSADHSELDVYSEYINKVAEYRFFVLNGKAFYWMEREPLNKKAASGVGNGKDKMMFKYIKKDITKLPNNFKKLILKFSKIFAKLPFICFDVMIDKDDNLYLIESNLHPGMPFDATVQLYRELFKDFYGREVNKKADEELKELSKYLDEKTLTHDPKRFEIA